MSTEFYTDNNMKGLAFHAKAEEPYFSEKELNIMLRPGERIRGSFVIRALYGGELNGYVLGDSPEMKCITEEFSGDSAEIIYEYSAEGRQIGERAEGCIRIISSQGEYSIPYHAEMELGFDHSGEPIRDLARFSAYAVSEPENALSLFLHNSFPMILDDSEQYCIYRGLTGGMDRKSEDDGRAMRCLEEFLVACGYKAPAAVSVEQEEIRTSLKSLGGTAGRQAGIEEQNIEKILNLSLTGWGFAEIFVKTEGEFLTAVTPVPGRLSLADFEDGTYELPVVIRRDKLHAGINRGRVVLEAPGGTAAVPVTVHCIGNRENLRIKQQQAYKTEMYLVAAYEEFRCGTSPEDNCEEKGLDLIDKYTSQTGSSLLAALYRVHFNILRRHTREAAEELDEIRKILAGVPQDEVMEMEYSKYRGENEILYCYRQFLTALCYRDDQGITPRVMHILQQRYRKDPREWRYVWMMIQLTEGLHPVQNEVFSGGETAQEKDEKEEITPAARTVWNMMRRLAESGCRSPLIYLEAAILLAEQPALLHSRGTGVKFDSFELNVIRYQMRKKILTVGVLQEICLLSARTRGFSAQLFWILSGAFDREAFASVRREILESICAMIVRGGLSEEKYFIWIRRGMDEGIRLAGLGEAYLMTMPEDYYGEIPEEILYDLEAPQSLPYYSRAAFYRCIIEKKDQYPDLYEKYKKGIRNFVQEQLSAGRISENLGFLYALCLTDSEIGGKVVSPALIPAIFSCIVKCERKGMQRVILVYEQCGEEESYPIRGGRCVLPVYSERYRLFFEDGHGNRELIKASDIRRINHFENYRDLLGAYNEFAIYYCLHAAYMDPAYPDFHVSAETEGVYRLIAESSVPLGELQKAARMKVLGYYIQNGQLAEHLRDPLLTQADPSDMTRSEKAWYLQTMTAAGAVDIAAKWCGEFGAAIAGDEVLQAIFEYLEKNEDPENGDRRKTQKIRPLTDPERLRPEIAFEMLRRGTADAAVLQRIAKDYTGSVTELGGIRDCLSEAGMDTGEIDRRILRQALYTGEMPENRMQILCECREDLKPSLYHTILAQFSHISFAAGNTPEPELLECIREEEKNGVQTADICRILYLRETDLADSMEEEEEELVQRMLQALVDRKVIMPFFRRLCALDERLLEYRDITIFMYREPGLPIGEERHVTFHYQQEGGEFGRKEMRRVYEGCYITGFLLFFGEELHYFITDDEEETNIVESGVIGQNISEREKETAPDKVSDVFKDNVMSGRYAILDRLSRNAAAHRDYEAIDLLKAYYLREEITSHLFHRDDYEER